MGPTASGKTDLATSLCDNFPMEIISVDSGQVFKGLDIGTAKPSQAVQKKYPHYLIDVLDPTETYSASQFRDDALEKMKEINNRKKIPILVGGTMMYFKFLTHGATELPGANKKIREEISQVALEIGWQGLHEKLCAVDPVAGGKISPNDSHRIQRSLEIFYITGKPVSEIQRRQKHTTLPFNLIKMALLPDKLDSLNQVIQERFKNMIDRGLLEEVRQLRSNFPLTNQMPSMRCVGYRQAWEYLEGKTNKDDFTRKGIIATRQLAKRQMTWLKTDNIKRFDCLSVNLLEDTCRWIKKNLWSEEKFRRGSIKTSYQSST